MTRKRNASIDFLRLVCMVMVVSMHYFGWGGVNDSPETTKINFVLASGIGVLCRVAVNCFYMITGFFIKDNCEEIRGKQLLRDVGNQYKKIWFYSVFVFAICSLTGIAIFSGGELLKSLFPIMSNRWWFMTVFMFLLCIKPFLAKMLTRLTEEELTVLILCVAFFDCIQAVLGHNAFAERGAGVLHACFMLILGYGMQRIEKLRIKKWPALFLYLGTCILAGGFSIVGKVILKAEDAVAVYYNSPLMVAASIGCFAFFVDWRCEWSWPTKIAPYVLAIYLINDHPAMQANFYEKVLHCSNYYGSSKMIFHWFACVVGFTILGIAIDFMVTNVEKGIKKIYRKAKAHE